MCGSCVFILIYFLALMLTSGDVPYKELPITVILPRVVSGYRLKKPGNCPNEV